MAKKVTTISVCLPLEVDKKLTDIATETNISKSAVATLMLSLILKNWDGAKGVLVNGV